MTDGHEGPRTAREELARLLPPRYRDLTPLGQGGMGLVFRALDTQSGQHVAIKVLAGPLLSPPSAEARMRFTRESEAIARVSHPFIVRIREVDDSGPLPYFVMDLAEGETLAHLLERCPEGNIVQGAHICLDICDALSHMHDRGVLHRDLKPENIAVGSDGGIKILDFGLASLLDDSTRVTGIGHLVGTPAYMAPERLAGGPADRRSDLYSVGVILYQFLTGHLPYASDQQYLKALRVPALPSTSNRAVSRSLDSVVMNLLDPEPARRPPTAADLRGPLASALREYREVVAQRPAADGWEQQFRGELERLSGIGSVETPRLGLESGEMREVIQVRVELSQAHLDGALPAGAFVEDRVLALFAQGLERFGARVERFEPGAVVAFLGTETAGEHHLESALAAAVEITQRVGVINGLLTARKLRLGARIGLDLLRIRTELDHSVDEASFGLVDLARCREGIWLTDRMYRRAGPKLGARDRVGELIEVVALPPMTVSAAERAKSPQRGGGPLVGRQAEWELLETLRNETWKDLQSGHARTATRSRLVALRGDPGVGKTRLAEEFLRRAGGERPMLMASAPALVPAPYRIVGDLLRRSLLLGAAAPEGAVREALQRYLDRSGASGVGMNLAALGYLMGLKAEADALEVRGASAVRAELVSCVRRLFAAWAQDEAAREAGPRIIVLDDVHRLDPASLEAIGAALTTAGPGLFLVACFRRPWELPETVRRAVDCRVIALEPLEPASAREFLTHLRIGRKLDPEEEERLLEQSSGNPLFLEEMALAMRSGSGGRAAFENARRPTAVEPRSRRASDGAGADLPDCLRNLVASRMDEMPARERELLQLAAVLGPVVDVAVLEGMATELWGGPPADLTLLLERLCVAGFLRPTEEGQASAFAFRPAIAREVIEASLLESNRRVLHLLALRVLEARSRETPGDSELVAYHASQAGLADRALEHSLVALKRASAREDAGAMISLAGDALDWISRLEAAQSGPVPEGMRVAHQDQVFAVLEIRELALEISGEVELQRADLAQMMELALVLEDPRRQAFATMRLARFLWWRLGDAHTAEELAQRSLALCRQVGDRRGQADVWRILGGTRRILGDGGGAPRHHRQALALYRAVSCPEGVVASLCSLARLCVDAGRVRYGLALARRAAVLEQAGDDHRSGGRRLRTEGALHLSAGACDRALHAYTRALASDTAVGYVRGEVKALLGMSRTLCAMERSADALDQLAAARSRLTQRGVHDLECEFQVLKAVALMLSPLPESHRAAVAAAALAIELADLHRLAPQRILARSVLARGLALTGEPARALTVSRQAVALLPTFLEGSLPPGQVQFTHSVVAAAAGRQHEAQAALVLAAAEVSARASVLDGQALRSSFLEGVPLNRQVTAAVAHGPADAAATASP